MAQTYHFISVFGFAMAINFSALSVFLWCRFGILKITGDLSGRNARKSIAEMRNRSRSQEAVPAGTYGGAILKGEEMTMLLPERGITERQQKSDHPVQPEKTEGSGAAPKTM